MTNSAKTENFLTQLSLRRDQIPSFETFPFNVPAIAALSNLQFDKPVTFFVGENGSGKSTLLEAIAIAWGLNPEGGSRNFRFSTHRPQSVLEKYLRLCRSTRRVQDSYFLRAESYFNLATEIESLDQEPGFGPKVIEAYGGKSLHEQSHGESFLAAFLKRLRGNGFYLFDEPEAALSPMRQLALLARMHDLVQAGSQFLIATHSPILMTYPHASLYLMDNGPPRLVSYHDTEHFILTRNFLNRPEKMLDMLLVESGRD